MNNGRKPNSAGFRFIERLGSPEHRQEEIRAAFKFLVESAAEDEGNLDRESLITIAKRLKRIETRKLELSLSGVENSYGELVKFVAKELGFTEAQGRPNQRSPEDELNIAAEYHHQIKHKRLTKTKAHEIVSKKWPISIKKLREIYNENIDRINSVEEQNRNLQTLEKDRVYLDKFSDLIRSDLRIGNPLAELEITEVRESVYHGNIKWNGVFTTLTSFDKDDFERTMSQIEPENDRHATIAQHILLQSEASESSPKLFESLAMIEQNWDECLSLLRKLYPL